MCKPWAEYIEKWRSMQHWTKIFCVVALVNYVSLFVLAIYPLVDGVMKDLQITNPSSFSYITTRTTTFVSITVFQVIHAWFGLFHDNIYEIYANLVSQIVVTVVVVFRCLSDLSGWDAYIYALFSYAIIFQALYIVFMFLIHSEYVYTFFQKAGADFNFRSMYRKYLRFQSLLKVDLMLAIISTMSFQSSSSWMNLLTFNFIIAVIAFIFFNIGRFGASLEHRPLMIVFWCLIPVQLVFYVYGIWIIVSNDNNLKWWNNNNNNNNNNGGNDGEKYSNYYLFLASACAGVIVRFVLLALSILAYKNFDKGLKNFEFLKNPTAKDERTPFTYATIEPRKTPRGGADDITVDEVVNNTRYRDEDNQDDESDD